MTVGLLPLSYIDVHWFKVRELVTACDPSLRRRLSAQKYTLLCAFLIKSTILLFQILYHEG
jgi:hypothetical protein